MSIIDDLKTINRIIAEGEAMEQNLETQGGETRLRTKEQAYDEQINPLMKQVIAICKEHKINAHATFFLNEDLVCTTHLKLEGDPLPLEIMHLADACGSNIDLLFITLYRYVHEGRYRNESSATLSVLADRQQAARRCMEIAESAVGLRANVDGAKAVAAEIRREFGL